MGALDDKSFLKKTVENNKKGLSYFSTELTRLGIQFVPSYGNFIMTVWKDQKEVDSVFKKLMKKGVLVRPLGGSLEHCIRVSVGRPEENEHFIEALEN